MRYRLYLLATMLLSLSAVTGCFDAYSDSQVFGHGAAGSSGGTTSESGTTTTTITPQLECVPSKSSDPIDAKCGVFVSPAGDDATGDGSPDKPYATIGKALATAATTVYACADAAKPFDEALVIESAGVFLFGALDCDTWKYDALKKTSLTAPTGSVPLTVTGGASIHTEDFDITARDAPALAANVYGPGGSSIALIAEAGSTLEMTRCTVTAGNGSDGAPGQPPAAAGSSAPDGDQGGDGCVDNVLVPGALGGQNMCEQTDVGGGGGGTGTPASSGGTGTGGLPAGMTGKGGLAITGAITCDTGGKGGNGIAGLPGDPGKGASWPGAISASGFVGASGDDGLPGMPGQGGGGGGGAPKCQNLKAGPSGGGGGAGGCGGAGGKGGFGGGASIVLITLGGNLTFVDTSFKAGDGAVGGAGASGTPGVSGGAGGMPGAGDATTKACPGGKGGGGGVGGRGGGGRGGHSIGLAYQGSQLPPMEGLTISFGKAGSGGMGEGADGNGADGIAGENLAL